jgi:hypothetical protein
VNWAIDNLTGARSTASTHGDLVDENGARLRAAPVSASRCAYPPYRWTDSHYPWSNSCCVACGLGSSDDGALLACHSSSYSHERNGYLRISPFRMHQMSGCSMSERRHHLDGLRRPETQPRTPPTTTLQWSACSPRWNTCQYCLYHARRGTVVLCPGRAGVARTFVSGSSSSRYLRELKAERTAKKLRAELRDPPHPHGTAGIRSGCGSSTRRTAAIRKCQHCRHNCHGLHGSALLGRAVSTRSSAALMACAVGSRAA